MKITCVLNTAGGTLKTTDIDWLSELIVRQFSAAGHDATVAPVSGKTLIETLEEAAGDKDTDAILAGGGDGTISAAAAIAAKAGKPLGILPAGTMNLFARSLDIPLDLERAVEALANGSIGKVDIAHADGEVFIHQFSLGLHPKMVRLRDSEETRSRWHKMSAGVKALFSALVDARALPLEITVDDVNRLPVNTAALSISNNLYGSGHLPYADRVDQGVLGVYLSHTIDFSELVRLAFDLSTGSLENNPNLEIIEARKVVIRHRRNRSLQAVMDGELRRMGSRVEITIQPGALKVIHPRVA